MSDLRTRHGVPVVRRVEAIGVSHYSVQHQDGRLVLHANPRCSRMRDPFRVSVAVVDTLWTADTGTTVTGQKGTMWCEKCAVRYLS